jgi:putative membrane protein
MRFFSHLILSFISNLVAILAANYYLLGFSVTKTAEGFAIVAALLTALNVFLKPLLKLILSPLIILTFGLFVLVLNAALLAALDFFSAHLTIDGLRPLLYATILITAVNVIMNFSVHRLSKKP